MLSHYKREEVIEEIVKFCRNRWVAVFGNNLFVRYFPDKTPLRINNKKEYLKLFKELSYLKIRTIYATLNIYKEIKRDLLKDPTNILNTTPSFDIDGSLEEFELIIELARTIIETIQKFNVEKSIYLIWSGRGIHIHLNENAISKELIKKYDPVNLARAVVNLILDRCKNKVKELIKKSKAKDRKLNVENLVDIQRVFTAPLSLHKEIDLVCVPIKPDDLDKFSLDWANINKFKYNKNWDSYEEGELDELVELAAKYLNNYEIKKENSKTQRKKEMITSKKRIGRFQVMALLQAARYYLIKERNLNKAKSFGLNRAIFYAWAKYYKYKVLPKKYISFSREVLEKENKYKFESVGNEQAPISRRGWFMIGGKEQLPEDFDKNVTRRIEEIIPFEKAWEKVINYLKRFPRRILEDQSDFYEKVYKPVRDNILKILLEDDKKENS